MTKNMKKTRRYSVAALTMLLSATFACGLAFSDRGGQGGSTLEAAAAEPLSVTKQVFGDGTTGNGGFTHEHVNDMVGMSVSWGKKTYVNTTRRTIANNTLSSTTVHSIWTNDAKNKNLAGSDSYVMTGTFAGHAGVKYYAIPGNSNKYNSSEAWRAAITAAMTEKNTYDTTQDSATYGEYTSWNYVLVQLQDDWTATEITGSYSWTQSSTTFKATRATSFEVNNSGAVVTYTTNAGDNLYNNTATMGSLSADDVPSAPFTHGRLGIPNNTYVILDLNGHTIDRNLTASADINNAYQYPSVFAVGTGARLEVFDGTATNSNPVGTGKLTGGNGCLSTNSLANVNKGGAFHLADNSEVTLHSGTATGGSTCLGGAVYLLGNAIFNLYEGKLTGNTAHRGGGVYLAQGSYSVFNMYGGEISSCATLVDGSSRGGAVCVYENAFCNIYGGKIHNNVAVWGGGISVDTNSYVKLYGGEISGNGAVKQGAWGASGAGVNLLAESYGVYINGPATVKGNYTLKDAVLSKFKGVNGVGSQAVTAVENRMTMNITLELEGGGNKVLENYEVAGNLFLSKKNTSNKESTKPTNSTLGYAEIKVQGLLSKDGKNAEVYVSPDGGAEGNHFGKIMHGFITAGYDDTQNQQNTGQGEVKDPDVWTTYSGDEYQYTSYLYGNAVGNYFKSDSGADIIETLDSTNARWVEITDLTKARTADVTWEYYDGTELGDARHEENWRPFSEYPDNIPPSAIYDDETNWLGRVRFVFNKFRDTDSNGYCDLMERFVVEYDGTEELFKYTKTTYRFKKGADTANNGDKKAENYELDSGTPALIKSGAWIESSIVYCDNAKESFTMANAAKGIKEAGTYTFKIGAAAKPGASSADDTVFSPSDVLTERLEQVQLKVAQRGLTVTGVEITKVYDGKIDVSDDLNKALASEDAATRITPTITGGWLAQHYEKIKVASEKENPFSGVILDSPDVGTHISTKFESLSLIIEDIDGGDTISRNYTVAGDLSNITVIITPAVLQNGTEGHTGGGTPYWTLKGGVEGGIWSFNSEKEALLATYTGQPINPELEIVGLTAQTAKTAEGFTTRKDNVILEYQGTQTNANADKDGNPLDGKAAYTVTAKITTADQGSNYVFEGGDTTFTFPFYLKQKELTVNEWTASGSIWKEHTATSGSYVYDGTAFTAASVEGNLTPTFTGLTEVDSAPSFTLALTAENSEISHAEDTYTVTVKEITDAPNYYLGNGGEFAVTIAKREVKVLVHELTDTYAGEKYLLDTTKGLKQGVQLADVFGTVESNPNSTWQYADDTPNQFIGTDSSELYFYLAGTVKPDGKPTTGKRFAVPGTYYLWCTFAEGNAILAGDYSVTFEKEGTGGDPQLTIEPATAEVISADWQLSNGFAADGYRVDITEEINENYSWMRFKGDVEYKQEIDGQSFTVTYELKPTDQQHQDTDYTVDGGIYTVITVGTYTFTVTVEAPYHEKITHKLLVYISQEHVTVTLKEAAITFTYGGEGLLQSGNDISEWLLKLLFNTDHIESITGFTNHEMGQDEGQDGPASIAMEAVETLDQIIEKLGKLVTLSFTGDTGALFSGAGYLKAGSYTVHIAFKGDTSGDTKNRTITFVNAANKIVVTPKTLTKDDIIWVETGNGWSEEGGKLYHDYSGIASIALGNYPQVKSEGGNALTGDKFNERGISAFIEAQEEGAWVAHTGVCHVGTTYRIYISDPNPGGADGANYTFDPDALAKEFSIKPLAITLKLKNFSDVYGNTHPDFGQTLELINHFDYSDAKFAEGDNIGLLNLRLAYVDDIKNSTAVGHYAVKATWDNADYAVTFTNESGTEAASEADWWKLEDIFEITRREIEIVWEAEDSYTFNGNDQSGAVKAHYVDAVDGKSTRALAVTFSGQGEQFLNAGGYTATVAFAGEDTGSSNYQLPEANTREFTMAKMSVSVVWDGEYTYNGTNQTAALQAHYLTFDEQPAALTVTLKDASEFKNAGDYSVTADFKADDGQSGNYELTDTTHTYTMSRAKVTVSGITAIDRIYDGTTSISLSFNGVKFEGLIDGDELTLSAVGEMEDKHAGEGKAVTVSGLSLSGKSHLNYELANEDYSESVTVNITPRTISISGITAQDKTYDGTTAATFDMAGLKFDNLLSDEAAHFTGVGAEKYVTVVATGEFSDKNAGEGKVITGLTFSLEINEAGQAAGFKAENYTILTTVQGLTATISPAEVTVTGGVVAEEKVYDGTTVAELIGGSLVFQVTGKEDQGLYGGDSLTVTGTGTFDDKNAGSGKRVTFTELVLGGASASNYVLAKSGNQAEATGAITQNPVAANEIVWPELTFTYSAKDQRDAIKPYFEGVAADGRIFLAIVIEGDKFTDADTYTVRATLVGVEGGENYTFNAEDYSHTYKIDPYTVEIEWTAWSKEEAKFDGKEKTVTATFQPLESGVERVTLTVKIEKAAGREATLLNAGTYTATASFGDMSGGTSNYTLDRDSLTHTYIIQKAEFVIGTDEGQIYTFNGTAQGEPITVQGVKGDENFPKEVTISYLSNSGNHNGINAGVYEIEYLVLGTENYNEARGTYTFTIEKAKIDVKVEDKSYEYNGEAQGNAAVIGETPDTPYTVVYTYEYTPNIVGHSEGDVTAPLFTEAGQYAVTVTVSGSNYVTNTQHYTITITRALTGHTVQSELEFTYDGAQQTATLSDAVIGAASELTYALKEGSVLPEGASFDAASGTFTFKNVAEGNGVVFTVTVNADNNHEAASGDVKIVVNKAAASLDTSHITAEYTYTGEEVKLDLTEEGLLNHSEGAKLSYTVEEGKTIKNAGIYSVTITAEATDNYLNAEATVSITVNRATFDKVEDQTFVYNGTPQGDAIVLKLNGKPVDVEAEHITIRYNGSETPPQYSLVNANAFVVNFTAEGDNFVTYGGSYTITITPATLTVSAPTETTYTYTGAPVDASATVKAIDNSYELSYDVTYSPLEGGHGAGTIEGAHFTEAGTYKVTVTVSGNNYHKATCSYTVTIGKGEYTVENSGDATFTYNGELQGGEVRVTTLTGSEQEVVYTGEHTFRNVSTNTVQWSVAADNNHNATRGSYTVTIVCKQLTVSGYSVSGKIYDKTTSANVVGGFLQGVCGGDDVSFTISAAFEDANAGNAKPVTVTIELTNDEAGNYTFGEEGAERVTKLTATLTADIDRALRTIDTEDVLTEYTYNGQEQTVDLSGVTYTGQEEGDGTLTHTNNTFTNVVEGNGLLIEVQVKGGRNYRDAVAYITLTVTPQTLTATLKERTRTFTYDGTPHGGEEIVTVTGGTVYVKDEGQVFAYIVDGGSPYLEVPAFTAGTHTVEVRPRNENYHVDFADGNSQYTVQIEVAEVVVQLVVDPLLRGRARAADLVYNGGDHASGFFEDNFRVTLRGEPYTIDQKNYLVTWRSAEGIVGLNAIDAGDYTLVLSLLGEAAENVRFKEDARYTVEGSTLTWNGPTLHIEKAALTVTAPADIETYYDGTLYGGEANVQVLGLVAGDEGYTLEYSSDGENFSTEKPVFINAGRHTVHFRIAARNYTAEGGSYLINIKKVHLTPTLNEGSYSYRGYAYSPFDVWTLKAEQGRNLLTTDDIAVTYTYTSVAGVAGSATSLLNAGTYTLGVELSSENAITNYTLGEGKLVITIAPAEVDISAQREITYRESGYEVGEVVRFISQIPTTGAFVLRLEGADRILDAGEYTVVVEPVGDAANNFAFTAESIAIVVDPAEVYVWSDGDLTRTYDGKDHLSEARVTVTRRDNSVVVDPSLYDVAYYMLVGGERVLTDDIVSAGDYYAVVTLKDTRNYKLTGAMSTRIVITRAVFGLVEGYEDTYNGAAVDPAVLIEREEGAPEPEYTVSIKRDGKTVEKICDAGFYTVYFTGGPNFLASVPFVYVTIGQRMLTVGEVPFKETTRVYDGTTDVTALLASSTVLADGAADEKVEVAVSAALASKDVGAQRAILTFAIADPNYILDEARAEELFGSILITVTAKPVQVLYNEDSVKKGGPFSATSNDFVLGDDVKLVYNSDDSGNTVVAELSLEGADAGNYTLTETKVVIPLRLLENKWIVEYYRADWKEGRTPSEVVDAVAQYGGVASVRYYTDEACTTEISEEELKTAAAGTYYAKYTVERGDYYEGMFGVSSFEILKADPDMGLPIILLIVCAVLLATLVTVVAVTKRRKHKKNIQ